MATKRPSFEKRERDRAKKAKADAKRERRHDRPGDEDDEAVAEPVVAVDEAAVLASLDELHRRFDAEEIDFDDFAEQRDALLAQLAGG